MYGIPEIFACGAHLPCNSAIVALSKFPLRAFALLYRKFVSPRGRARATVTCKSVWHYLSVFREPPPPCFAIFWKVKTTLAQSSRSEPTTPNLMENCHWIIENEHFTKVMPNWFACNRCAISPRAGARAHSIEALFSIVNSQISIEILFYNSELVHFDRGLIHQY